MRRALGMAVLAACQSGPPPERCVVGTPVPDSASSIGCAADYEALGYEQSPFVEFAHTNTVNVIVRLDSGTLYLVETATWWLHFDFVYFVLEGHPESSRGTAEYLGAMAEFGLRNYHSLDREYLLAKLVQYHDQGKLVLELAPTDIASPELIIRTYDEVHDALYNGDELVFRPASNLQEKLIPQLEGEIPIVTSQELFAGQVFQPLNPAVGFGYLRFRRASELDGVPPLPVDIVVLDRVPADITIVSGVVTADFQTPLSHINILSKNRGIPNMALRDAWNDPGLRAQEGALVKLTVGEYDFAVEPATELEARAWWDTRRPESPLVPQHDLSVTQNVDLVQAGATASALYGARVVGAKAANFAEMMRITAPRMIRLPLPAYAIPLSAFDKHMTDNGLWPVLDAIDAEVQAGTLGGDELHRRLFSLRWAIYQAPMDTTLRDDLVSLVTAQYGAAEVRFRSSTNVEDLREFSGAGLYTSAGASVTDGPLALERAVKVVWASVFNAAAFIERDFYRVDQRQVMMGVLMHPAFEDELANGVSLSMKDSNNQLKIYVNAQRGEVSVTNPTGLAVPEQILWSTWFTGPEYEVFSRSSLTGGASVLTDEQYAELIALLTGIHNRFQPIYCQIPGTSMVDPNCAIDCEWKLASDGQVYVKQARPLRSGP